MTGHEPERPGWDCACCGKPWPCDPARERIATARSTERVLMMVAYMGDAARDRPWEPVGELYERFVGWTR